LPIYTRAGDDGLTYVPLFKGVRVPKDNLILEVIGTLDELNSYIGLVRSYIRDISNLRNIYEDLRSIQVKLFNIGFELVKTRSSSISDTDISELEAAIDELSKHININVFVVPTGHIAASTLHVARTICRRFERLLVRLSREYPGIVSSNILRYINRLSDYLYVAALYVNKVTGVEEEVLNM